MEVFRLLRHVLNDDLSGLIATYVALQKRTLSLEWRYRREVVRYEGSDTLFIVDLLMTDGAENARREDGLLFWVFDDTDYVPTRCHVPAGTKVCEWMQVHTTFLRDPEGPVVNFSCWYKYRRTVGDIDDVFPALTLDKSNRTTAPYGFYD